MSEPIVFVSHFRIREGKLDPFERLTRQVTQRLEEEKPRTLLFAAYRDGGGTRATFVHVFGDADSMDGHFEGAEERSRAAYEFLEPAGWEIYGIASDEALSGMRQAATALDTSLTLMPAPIAGFLRTRSA